MNLFSLRLLIYIKNAKFLKACFIFNRFCLYYYFFFDNSDVNNGFVIEDDLGDRASLQSPTGTDLASATSPGSNDSLNEGNRGLASCRNIHDIAKKGQMGWHGSLILKNSSFPCK